MDMQNPPTGISLSDYISALRNDHATHARVTFINRNIVLEDENIEAGGGILISSVLNGDENLTMGRAVMSSVSITFIKNELPRGIHWDEEIKVEIGVENDGETYWTQMGLFTGTKRYSYVTTGIMQYTANDRMQKFDTVASPWIATLTFPMTVAEMYHSMCNYVGVPYKSGDELVNIMARKYTECPHFDEGITLREILSFIAEACGCYCKITPDGYCQMVWFKDHTNDIQIIGDDEFSLQYFDLTGGMRWQELEEMTWEELEDYTWADLGGYTTMFVVDGLVRYDSDTEESVSYPAHPNGNIYKIIDNPFLKAAGSSEQTIYIKPIFTRLSSLGGYLPLNMVTIGNPLIETGDIILVQTESENPPTPVFARTFMWNGAANDSIDVTGTIQREG